MQKRGTVLHTIPLFLLYISFLPTYINCSIFTESSRNPSSLKENLKHTMIVLGVMPIVTFFIKHISITFTFWMIWILVICFFPFYWYAKANKQIRVLKAKRGWDVTSEVSYTDLKIAALPRKVKLLTFLPALICFKTSIT